MVLPISLHAGPLTDTALKIVQNRDRIVVGKQELVVEYHTAVNTLTQKKVTYAIRILDKFDRELYHRQYDVPFGAFAENDYQNNVSVRSVIGTSGVGVAVMAVTGPTYDAPRVIDLIGVRAAGSTMIGPNALEIAPIAEQFPNQFVVPPGAAKPIRLGKGDTWTYRYWSGSYYLHIPLIVDWYGALGVIPKQTEFYVEVPAYRRGAGQVLVHTKPNARSAAAYLTMTPSSDVKFIRGYGVPRMEGKRLVVTQCAVRVEINARSGWVLDPESLAVLGLRVPKE